MSEPSENYGILISTLAAQDDSTHQIFLILCNFGKSSQIKLNSKKCLHGVRSATLGPKGLFDEIPTAKSASQFCFANMSEPSQNYGILISTLAAQDDSTH